MPEKTALITGISGQDGCYLSALLLEKGYRVHGWTRSLAATLQSPLIFFLRQHCPNVDLQSRLTLSEVDLFDAATVQESVAQIQPGEIYNLAGQSRPGDSFASPKETFEANTQPVLHLLEAIRHTNNPGQVRLFQAGSAEVFAGAHECPQSESTPLAPLSPYGVSKATAQLLVATYRQNYGLHACTGILYNHESPLRSTDFVTGKIVDGVARIAMGQEQDLTLGNLDVTRDWGFARDYVEAMWRMLQHEAGDDFVIATGRQHSLKQFLNCAFSTVGLDWQDYTRTDTSLKRSVESIHLCGDPTRIRQRLNWEAETPFESMVELMVRERIVAIRDESSASTHTSD